MKRMVQLFRMCLLVIITLQPTECVNCYTCNNITDVNQCKASNITTCTSGQSCYTATKIVQGVEMMTLGCKDAAQCSITAPISIVGRHVTTRQAQHCMECCSTDMCNIHLCSNQTTTTCADDNSVDCTIMDTSFNICSKTQNAKLFCPKYCGLCSSGPVSAVDGNWTQWSGWSQCDVSCGHGRNTRTRSCSNPQPEHGGHDCVGSKQEIQSCQTTVCPVDGLWSSWSGWSKCNVSCDSGMKTRTRTCSNPQPANGGHDCRGSQQDTQICHTTTICPVQGSWNSWSGWSQCDVSCGYGMKTRTRSCTNPQPAHGGHDCVGRHQDTQICHTATICPVDGLWSSWSGWSQCDVSCDSGTRTRTRTCTNPQPDHGGHDCVGSQQDNQICQTTTICPVDGFWSSWTGWSQCDLSCGYGMKTRTRSCTNPQPDYGGHDCVGSQQDSQICQTTTICPVDGSWSSWSGWSQCDVSCGYGMKTRTRSCTNPQPAHGGHDCIGSQQDSQICHTATICPVDGFWSTWSGWSQCGVSCGSGMKTRTRSCTNPQPDHGGHDCVGSQQDTQICHTTTICPVDGSWSSWSGWSQCDVSCGYGRKTRTRSCTNPQPEHDGHACIGSQQDTQICHTATLCPVQGSWSSWSGWSQCGVSCDSGTKTRTRSCTNPQPAHGGHDCVGSQQDTQICHTTTICPVDGSWSSWSGWSQCDVSCGYGMKTRSRSCTNPQPEHGGHACIGSQQDNQICHTATLCPVNGVWSSWSGWSHCDVSCDSGTKTRTRSCTNPQPAHGGHDCVGRQLDTQICHTATFCPVVGKWTLWTGWSQCDVSCGHGTNTRTRSCTNPQPDHGGHNCVGSKQETLICQMATICPVHGGWSSWNSWGTCSKSCDTGTQHHTRTCTNPSPAHSGDSCIGRHIGYRPCSQGACADLVTNGGWSAWSYSGGCSVTCGQGYRTQTRSCTNPVPSLHGQDCIGYHSRAGDCTQPACDLVVINGGWSTWSYSGGCSVTCGQGYRTQTRSCTNPVPSRHGQDCIGHHRRAGDCTQPACVINGGWSTWSYLGGCSVTCGQGYRTQTRSCTNPVPSLHGQDCIGHHSRADTCTQPACDLVVINGGWSPWSYSGGCSVTCGQGYRTQTRACTNPVPSRYGQDCIGYHSRAGDCTQPACE